MIFQLAGLARSLTVGVPPGVSAGHVISLTYLTLIWTCRRTHGWMYSAKGNQFFFLTFLCAEPIRVARQID
ncbi:hypothetical protein V8E52_004620 [Russula decolorans]